MSSPERMLAELTLPELEFVQQEEDVETLTLREKVPVDGDHRALGALAPHPPPLPGEHGTTETEFVRDETLKPL